MRSPADPRTSIFTRYSDRQHYPSPPTKLTIFSDMASVSISDIRPFLILADTLSASAEEAACSPSSSLQSYPYVVIQFIHQMQEDSEPVARIGHDDGEDRGCRHVASHEDERRQHRPEGTALRALRHFQQGPRHGFREPHVAGKRSAGHHRHGWPYPRHDAAVTVSVTGVSLTNARLHDWHGCADTALTGTPCAMLTAVGAAAL